MSLTATSKSGWIFAGLTPGMEFKENDDEDKRLAKIEMKRNFVVYRRKMVAKGNVVFVSEQGSVAAANTLKSDLSASDKNKAPTVPSSITKMLCTRDTLENGPQGSGIVTNMQEWTAYTPYEDWDPATELA